MEPLGSPGCLQAIVLHAAVQQNRKGHWLCLSPTPRSLPKGIEGQSKGEITHKDQVGWVITQPLFPGDSGRHVHLPAQGTSEADLR